MKHVVHEHQLPSGASGLVIHVPGSAVVNIRVTFRSGFQYADPSSYEVPHIMEHLLATVTQKHSAPNAFMIEAQKNGAYVNASTSAENNEYIYECAQFELERLLGLIEEQVVEPLFADAPFKAEKGNVLEELTRNTTQHMSVCTIRLAQQASPKLWRDYGERLAQLDAITLAQLEEHYTRTHTAANARFYVAGDFKDGGAAVAKIFDSIFARLPKGARLKLDQNVGRGGAKALVATRDIDQLYYRSGVYFEELSEHDRSTLALLRMLMVGGMGSRVVGEARRRGLAYSVGASGSSGPGNSSFGFAGYVTPDHAEAVFEIIRRSMKDVSEGGCSLVELEAAQDLLVGSVTRSTQTAGDVLQWYIDRYDEEGIVWDFDNGLELLRTVSVADITRLTQQIVSASEQGLSLVGRVSPAEVVKYSALLRLTQSK
jgi:predicted Zn-dependent peptidase